MRGRNKEPTCTSLVLKALIACNDFMNYRMLIQATGCSANRVSAACIHLRNRKAVDVIIDKDGVGWWYATPETDDRIRHCDERTPEEPGTRRRRKGTRERRKS